MKFSIAPTRPSQRATSHFGTFATLVLVLVASFVPVTSAAGATQSASLAGVTATFTYSGTYPEALHPRLTITRSGAVLYDELVHSVWCGQECWPDTISASRKGVHVVRLKAHAQPAVVLDLYSGGAHCCSIEQVYSFGATSRTVLKTERNFGDPGVKMDSIGADGAVDFVSANDAFAYAFTDYAASGVPIQIFSFSHHYFRDVTRSFPSLIAKDAAQWRRAFDAQAATHYQDSVGVIAAWAADEDMLGHGAVVSTFLAGQARAGHLNSALSPIEPSGRRFVIALRAFLRKYGYSK